MPNGNYRPPINRELPFKETTEQPRIPEVAAEAVEVAKASNVETAANVAIAG